MFEEVVEILVETLNIEKEGIRLDSKLNDDLGIDSLASVELVLELENRYDIKIADEELANLVTVEDVVKCIESKK